MWHSWHPVPARRSPPGFFGRRIVFALGGVAIWLAASGCFHYQQRTIRSPFPASSSTATLPDAAATGSSREGSPSAESGAPESTVLSPEKLGRTRVTRMDGSVVELDNSFLDESGITGVPRQGTSRTPLSIPRADIRSLQVRQLNKGATALLAGAAVAGTVVVVSASGGDDEGGGYTPPE